MSLVGMGAEKLNQQHMETLGRLSGHFLDQVRGLTTLQLFGATRPAMYSIAEVTEDYRQARREQVLATSAKDFADAADLLAEVARNGHVVVMGSEKALTEAKKERNGFLTLTKVM